MGKKGFPRPFIQAFCLLRSMLEHILDRVADPSLGVYYVHIEQAYRAACSESTSPFYYEDPESWPRLFLEAFNEGLIESYFPA